MYSIPFVVLMGMGIVFVGLVSIIFLTMFMSKVLADRKPETGYGVGPETGMHRQQAPEEDLQLIAAIFSVLADDLQIDTRDARITVEKA